ncbi:MAG: bifunctional phosphopantothenoylcysteine decarboxylase/phosphopantothenate--cysteine ligase CoaBC [Paludibacteraceae bacterium]|nr:bifunctional phosphopantothenoylcysteine decarboxylase/phosphopantothenate--cysteine ligase CoaBC [Paludibacteraceae bacterium]
MTLQGKHILVGISGGIAAYKIPELIRLLQKEGAEVRVTTTENALQFVTELTLRTLTGALVYSDVFAAVNQHATEHISLPDWADLMVIAPATANILGKMAHGIADDALTTTFAAMLKPVVIAPAMNDKMYINPATQDAMHLLSSQQHITMLDCATGYLACGSEGKGRMQEIDVIAEAVISALTPKTLLGKKVMITSGPTQEKLDPVRFISNFSTGKQGRALAKEAARRGAEVTLISGSMSAQEMYETCMQTFPQMDIAILAAAVADFTPEEVAPEKIKKQPGQTEMILRLRKTPDIAASLGKIKRQDQTLIGFALETENEEFNALRKLEQKNLDMIVLNSLKDKGAGFGYDTNKVTFLTRDGHKKSLPLMSKEETASEIINCLS